MLKILVSFCTKGPVLPSAFSDGSSIAKGAIAIAAVAPGTAVFVGPLVGSLLNCMLGVEHSGKCLCAHL